MKPDEEFRTFYDAEVVGLRRFAYRLTADWAQAEDLAQEAMLRTLRAWRRIRERERPAVYARAIVVNRHRSLIRRAALEARKLVAGSARAAHPGIDVRAMEIWEEVQRLPVRQREAVVLHYYEDLSQNEIARIMGCPPGTVNSLVFRGIARLRARLEGDDAIAGSEA